MKIKKVLFLVILILSLIEVKAQDTDIACQAILDRKIDSIYINTIGYSRYYALRDSILIRIKINVDSTGTIIYAKVLKAKNINISQDTLLTELKKIKLPCLYTVYASYPYWKGEIMINFKNKKRE